MNIDFIKVSDIKKIKEDSDYFVVGLHFYDPYIFDKAYMDKYFKLPFSESDRNMDEIVVPSKLKIAEYLKEILATGKINPPCFSDEDIKSCKAVSAFVIYVNIYGYSNSKKRAYMMATTEMSVLTNPNSYDPTDETTYRIKSNNKILWKATKKHDDAIEDYGEE